ncbi:MAG TPA: hypothetical protein VKA15_23965, partial [Isosphaeraceae bacterium]|nr:hypothetical protein [Isosphaeraceae bacterium]
THPVGLQGYSPLTQDTPSYYEDYSEFINGSQVTTGANSGNSGGYGLPFAYDPLWRYQTPSVKWVDANGKPLAGYQLGEANANGQLNFEARFGAGIGFIQNDPSDGNPPSAHGLQRLTNFNRPYIVSNGSTVPIMPVSTGVPNIFVSPEDVVWVENIASSTFSPILPDMGLAKDLSGNPTSINDWHYSWMFTGQQNNASSGSSFEGNLVILENRPFGITAPASVPNPNVGNFQAYQVDGETVVEAIFGYSTKVLPYGGGQYGFGVSADRAVLLRWYASEPDPVVRVGDWIADVTYERNALVVGNAQAGTGRFFSFPQFLANGTPTNTFGGLQNLYNNGEWDNLPAQRCYWYRVQKIIPATIDSTGPTFRSMIVYVDRSLQARTALQAGGQPWVRNAALICPSVVNVIPQTIFTK